MLNQIKQTVAFLKEKGMLAPKVGIVLGTGLGKLADRIKAEVIVDYEEIPNFPLSTVESHSGKLIYGLLNGKKVVAMQGRFHFYEGYSMQQITFPIRVMKLLGIDMLFLSNACGAINLNIKKGSLMLIDDHINLLPGNPLIGPNLDELGPRFPDMSAPYEPQLISKFEQVAQKNNIEITKGVYVAVAGPNLETRAEYRFLSRIGADVVGMSTVPEVIVANHMNLPCVAVSIITDECDPDNLQAINIKEVLEVAGKAEQKLVQLFSGVLDEL